MIVLHGWWSIRSDPRGELIVWAEDSEAPSQPPVRRGRRPAKQGHPFAVCAQALAAATACDGAPGTAVLALPNQGRGPDASAEVRWTGEQSQTPGPLAEGRRPDGADLSSSRRTPTASNSHARTTPVSEALTEKWGAKRSPRSAERQTRCDTEHQKGPCGGRFLAPSGLT